MKRSSTSTHTCQLPVFWKLKILSAVFWFLQPHHNLHCNSTKIRILTFHADLFSSQFIGGSYPDDKAFHPYIQVLC